MISLTTNKLLLIFITSIQYEDMEQTSKLQEVAVDLVLKYFGQSTAEIYNHFFDGESDEDILSSVNEIMVEYLGEKKAKEEIDKYIEKAGL